VEAFRKLLEARNALGGENIKLEALKTRKMNFKTQKDGHNCGVHLCFFIQELVAGRGIGGDIKPDEFRVCMRETILKSLINVRDKCPLCENVAMGENNEWIECDVCSRWFHLRCANAEDRREEFEREGWACILCDNWLKATGQREEKSGSHF
jgi:hypothetical protein